MPKKCQQGDFIVLVLLSAHVERFSFSRMKDFFLCIVDYFTTHLLTFHSTACFCVLNRASSQYMKPVSIVYLPPPWLILICLLIGQSVKPAARWRTDNVSHNRVEPLHDEFQDLICQLTRFVCSCTVKNELKTVKIVKPRKYNIGTGSRKLITSLHQHWVSSKALPPAFVWNIIWPQYLWTKECTFRVFYDYNSHQYF